MGARLAVRRAGDALLSVTAVVGACCLVAFALGAALGVHPLVFRSGSMAPGIPTGSLGFVRSVPADAVRVGDVVSVPYGDTRVTHRVVGIERGTAATMLRLKGDANPVADPAPYPTTDVQRLWFSVPVLGGVIAWLSKPPGIYVLGLYAAVLFTLLLRRESRPPRDGDPDPRPVASGGHGDRAKAMLRTATVAGTTTASLLMSATPGWAAWTDGVTVAGTRLAAATVPAPANFSCGTLGVASVTFTWSAVTGATSYTLHFGTSGATTTTTTSTSAVVTALAASGTAWVEANRAFPSVTWTSGPSNTRTYSNVALVVSTCS